MNPLEIFAQFDRNLEALRSFHSLFEFKKIVENEVGCKITFDQLGEIVNLIVSNAGTEVVMARLPEILRGS